MQGADLDESPDSPLSIERDVRRRGGAIPLIGRLLGGCIVVLVLVLVSVRPSIADASAREAACPMPKAGSAGMYVSLKSGRAGAGIYAVSPDASLRLVARTTASPVKISPDGRQLLFIRSTSESQTFVVSCRDGSNAREVLTGEGVVDWASPNSIIYIDRSGLVTTIDLPSGRKRKVVRDGRLGWASELRVAGGVAVVGVRSSIFLVDFSNPSGSVDVKRDGRFYMGVAAHNRDIYALRETIDRQGPYVVADADLWTLKGGSHEWRTVRASVGAPIDMEVTSDGRCLILVYRLYSESSNTGVFLFDLNSLKSKRILSGNKFTSAVAVGGCASLMRGPA